MFCFPALLCQNPDMLQSKTNHLKNIFQWKTETTSTTVNNCESDFKTWATFMIWGREKELDEIRLRSLLVGRCVSDSFSSTVIALKQACHYLGNITDPLLWGAALTTWPAAVLYNRAYTFLWKPSTTGPVRYLENQCSTTMSCKGCCLVTFKIPWHFIEGEWIGTISHSSLL